MNPAKLKSLVRRCKKYSQSQIGGVMGEMLLQLEYDMLTPLERAELLDALYAKGIAYNFSVSVKVGA